jgi:phosphoserine phosphatase RsbU/P
MKKFIITLMMLFLVSTAGFCQTRSLLEKKVDSLDSILQVAQDQVRALKIRAEVFYEIPDTNRSFWAHYLRDNPESEGLFSMDSVPENLKDHTGNLTGQGSLRKRTRDFMRDLDMALELYPQFIIAHSLLPNAQWVYFTSKHDFFNVYPWVPSAENHFTDSIHEEKFFVLGLPENNPKRSPFWTPVYLDEAGMGLMVTLAAPVYEHKDFKGTVALDLTLAEIHKLLRRTSMPSKSTLVLLINDEDQVLANPSWQSPINKVCQLSEIVPDDLKDDEGFLDGYPENKIYEFKGHTIRYMYLKHAPWRLVFIK